MLGRGELQEMNEAVLKPKNWAGVEKPIALFIIFGSIAVFIKKGLLSWGFLIWVVIALIVWTIGLILFSKDPYFVRHRIEAFKNYEFLHRYRFLYPKSYKGKSLELKKKGLFDIKYIGTRRKK